MCFKLEFETGERRYALLKVSRAAVGTGNPSARQREYMLGDAFYCKDKTLCLKKEREN